MTTNLSNKELVNELAKALNANDIATARRYLADDLHFQGVFGPPIDSADNYLSAMERLNAQQTVLQLVEEEDEVACFYELSLPNRQDIKLFGAGWFKITNKLISSIRVVFDPTPLGKS